MPSLDARILYRHCLGMGNQMPRNGGRWVGEKSRAMNGRCVNEEASSCMPSGRVSWINAVPTTPCSVVASTFVRGRLGALHQRGQQWPCALGVQHICNSAVTHWSFISDPWRAASGDAKCWNMASIEKPADSHWPHDDDVQVVPGDRGPMAICAANNDGHQAKGQTDPTSQPKRLHPNPDLSGSGSTWLVGSMFGCWPVGELPAECPGPALSQSG